MGAYLARRIPSASQPPSSGTQPIVARSPKSHAAEAVAHAISIYLGPTTANAAVTTCCRALGRDPESLELREVGALLAALEPMLGTLLGRASCRILLRHIAQHLGAV